MVYYLSTAAHDYTVRWFLEGWRPDLADTVELLSYETLDELDELPSATYIFSDLERLTVEGRRWAAAVGESLRRGGAAVLNGSRHSLDRVQLLQRLHELGLNDFAVRHPDAPGPRRYPVFLRSAWDHRGPLTGPWTAPCLVDTG